MRSGLVVITLIVASALVPVTPAYAHRTCVSAWQGEEGFAAIVDLSDLCLFLSDGHSFPIAGPSPKFFSPKGTAVVRAVIVDPWWYPTTGTIDAYAEKYGKKLPEKIAPYIKDRRNAMGRLKVQLDFLSFRGEQVFRIHGTNKPSSIGRRESRGCIRLYNDHAMIVGNTLIPGDKILFQD